MVVVVPLSRRFIFSLYSLAIDGKLTVMERLLAGDNIEPKFTLVELLLPYLGDGHVCTLCLI